MGGFAEFDRYDALGLAKLVRKGEVSAGELVDEAIARIEERNPRINAVIFKTFASARAAALTPGTGPFAGVPFLLKDMMAAMAGTPMSCGNRVLARLNSKEDDEIVRRYRRAGLIIVGKTNLPEFGLSPVTEPETFGSCRNPWDLRRTPGGSSGGGAAAVAARMLPMAHGTDGGGSIRIPASCCGLFGLKPSRGRMPRDPFQGGFWNGWTAAHAITRSVRDSAALLDATSGAGEGEVCGLPAPERPFLCETVAQPGRLRIAFTRQPFLAETVHADCLAGLDETLKLLPALGHEVEEVIVPFNREDWLRAFFTIVAGETEADLRSASALAGRKLGFHDMEAASYIAGMLGGILTAQDYALAMKYLQQWTRGIGEVFLDHDVLLTPTLPEPPKLIGTSGPAPVERMMMNVMGLLRMKWLLKMIDIVRLLGERSLQFTGCTPFFNITGQPVMSVPLYWSAAGLPIGMQFAGRFGDEAALFRLASQLEEAKPWFDKAPPGYRGG